MPFLKTNQLIINKLHKKFRTLLKLTNSIIMNLHVLSILLLISLFSCKYAKKENTVLASFNTTEIKNTQPTMLKKEKSLEVYGIDISKYQSNEIDKLDKKQDHLSFVICKATEGITYTDPKFLHNWNTIKKKLFVRGAYHFYRSNDDPIAQATHFLKTISNIEATDFPPIIDFERSGIDTSQPKNKIQTDLKNFIAKIEKTLKCTPIIYTSVSIGNSYLDDPFFAKYPLWIASYNGQKKPTLPKIWEEKSWTIWQKSPSYKFDGFTDDFDVFNGNLQELKTFIKKSYH